MLGQTGNDIIDLIVCFTAGSAATYELSVNRVVQVHTFIGDRKPWKDGVPADGGLSLLLGILGLRARK